MGKVSGGKRMMISYGSNISTRQMAYRCPDAVPVCAGVLKDYELVFQGRRGNAHANVIPAEGKQVPIMVWLISAKDEATLDIYEGVRGGYYRREFVYVETEHGAMNGLIYVMNPCPYNYPSRAYFDVIEEGYEEFGFPVNVLDEALSVSARRMIREGA